MRIIVLSDTHGKIRNFRKIYLKQKDAYLFIHLGDGESEVVSMRTEYPNSSFMLVKGNCDFSSTEPEEKLIVLNNKRIYMTHGHKFNVKRCLDSFFETAMENRADIALFGHTHIPLCEYFNGMYVLNPGSAEFSRNGIPKFGIIDITDSGDTVAYLSDI